MRRLIVVSDLNIKGIEILVSKNIDSIKSQHFFAVDIDPVLSINKANEEYAFNSQDIIVIWCSFGSLVSTRRFDLEPDVINLFLDKTHIELNICLQEIKRTGVRLFFVCASATKIIPKEMFVENCDKLSKCWENSVFKNIEQQGIDVLYENDICHIQKLSARRWYALKNPYTIEFMKKMAQRIAIKARTQLTPLKVLAVDLDNTLWGGVLGEDGAENLKIGGIDQIGELHWDIQLSLQKAKEKGFVLGILSKNNLHEVQEALEILDMPLTLKDFAFIYCSWEEKRINIVKAADELNVSLNSFAFVDDSPFENEKMKIAHPEVLLLKQPHEKFMWVESINYACHKSDSMTSEDTLRSTHYALEKERKALLANNAISFGSSQSDKIFELLNVEVRPAEFNASRASQLFQRTNQFNLSTRRLGVEETKKLHDESDFFKLYSVSDKYGDYGITALVSITISENEGLITDFLISCRALGRNIEQFILEEIKYFCKSEGCSSIYFSYKETKKNAPMRSFLEKSSLLNKKLLLS